MSLVGLLNSFGTWEEEKLAKFEQIINKFFFFEGHPAPFYPFAGVTGHVESLHACREGASRPAMGATALPQLFVFI